MAEQVKGQKGQKEQKEQTGQDSVGPLTIVVCIKQVPLLSALRFDPETRRLIREGVPLEVNELDLYALSEAVRLRAQFGGEVIAITMGPPQAHEALAAALAIGADEAIHLSDRAFGGADTAATARTLALAIQREHFDLILCGRHSIDAETAQVGPELAEMLNLPQVISLILSNTTPAMTTLRAGMLHAAIPDFSRAPIIEPLPTAGVGEQIRTQITSREYQDTGVAELESASIVLGVGMGMGEPAHYAPVYRLAKLLNAAISATRNVTDAGYLPKQKQVGLTGRAISPRLYIALGIRGAAEHLAGIRKAGYIVAINKNKRAAIFKQADVGVVGDVHVLLPLLIEQLEKRKDTLL